MNSKFPDLGLFLDSGAIANKAGNPDVNERREDVLSKLFPPVGPKNSQIVLAGKEKAKWIRIQSEFEKAFRLIMKAHPNGAQVDFFYLERHGGKNRFDFFLNFGLVDGSTYQEKIEFKFGKSIYSAPEFLQIYAKPKVLIGESTISYPEYVYDKYSKLIFENLTAGLTKEEYLSEVYGQKSKSKQLEIAISEYKKKGKFYTALVKAHHDSVHKYLTHVENLADGFSIISLNDELASQFGKHFVNWDYKTQTVNMESFTTKAMTVSGSPTFLLGNSGLRTSLVYRNLEGNEIRSLLRWKNRSLMLGPAWQISIRK